MDSLMKHIKRISRCFTLYREDKLKDKGINGYQHTYILKIYQNPGISQEQLANMIFVDKSNVTRQLSALEQNGFIERIPNTDDQRQLLVFPTEKAKDLYPLVCDTIREWNKSILSGLSPDEQKQLISLLDKVAAQAIKATEVIQK
ncbi:MAG: hypothetical protein A2Y17_03425 [Clostridiales bacterium GWF2_38_85]|nr:MAG: hypothetical protein A2Y17_03425 [Clostridiales bacterium GWF2_38_85]